MLSELPPKPHLGEPFGLHLHPYISGNPLGQLCARDSVGGGITDLLQIRLPGSIVRGQSCLPRSHQQAPKLIIFSTHSN